MTPSCSFLSRWVFCGWVDEGEEFGIHSNHHALQCRGLTFCTSLPDDLMDFSLPPPPTPDHRYWTQGYVAADQCTPTFLSPHGHTLLACGKALNLLRICCPKVTVWYVYTWVVMTVYVDMTVCGVFTAPSVWSYAQPSPVYYSNFLGAAGTTDPAVSG